MTGAGYCPTVREAQPHALERCPLAVRPAPPRRPRPLGGGRCGVRGRPGRWPRRHRRAAGGEALGPTLVLLGIAALLGLAAWLAGSARRLPAGRPARLPGLLDPEAFRDDLAAAFRDARPDRPPAMIVLELDGFAAIRDTLGPEGGDALLRQVGERLLATARADDGIARTALAEFAILQRDGAQPDAAARFAARLVRELPAPTPWTASR